MSLAVMTVLTVLAFYVTQYFYVVSQAWLGDFFGAGVRTLSVGCGPTLYSRFVNGVEWRFRLIPLGGYTQFQASDDEPLRWSDASVSNEGPSRFVIPENAPRDFSQLSVPCRFLVLVIGPLSTVLCGAVLIAVCLQFRGPTVCVDLKAGNRVQPSGVPGFGVDDHAASLESHQRLLRHTFFEFMWRVCTFQSLAGWSGWLGCFVTCGAVMEQSPLAWCSAFGVLCVGQGLFNLLPIPFLNGGHIVFLFLETLTRRRVESLPVAVVYPSVIIMLVLFGRLIICDFTWFRSLLSGG